MRTLLVLLCVGLLAGCSPVRANPVDTPRTGSGADQRTATEGQLNEPIPTPERNSTEVTPTAFQADLEDYGLAPELTNEVWLNSDQALRLADLRGKVILLDMWTFG